MTLTEYSLFPKSTSSTSTKSPLRAENIYQVLSDSTGSSAAAVLDEFMSTNRRSRERLWYKTEQRLSIGWFPHDCPQVIHWWDASLASHIGLQLRSMVTSLLSSTRVTVKAKHMIIKAKHRIGTRKSSAGTTRGTWHIHDSRIPSSKKRIEQCFCMYNRDQLVKPLGQTHVKSQSIWKLQSVKAKQARVTMPTTSGLSHVLEFVGNLSVNFLWICGKCSIGGN